MLDYSRLFLLSIIFSICTNAQSISFEQHSIDLYFPGIQYVKIADIDNDGDLDIIGGSEITPTSASRGLAYWRNNGDNPITWTRFAIDQSFIHVMSVDAAYVDSDNHIDVIATSWELNQVAWWKNSGDPQSGWTKYVVKNNYTNAHDAKGIDIDQDGDTDIVACNSNPGSVDICYNQNRNNPTWNSVQIESVFSSAKSVEIIDLDFDNDLYIVGAADGANDIAWWENTGSNSQVWNKTTIENFFQGASFTSVIDMNNDSVLDLIANAWIANQVAYWICNDLAANNWTKHIVTTTLETPCRTIGCDFDMDGDVDIIAVGKIPGELVLFINDNFTFTEQVLYPVFDGGAALAVADLDQDGDQDIIAGASGLGDLLWWENQIVTSVDDNKTLLSSFALKQNYPNPFNPATVITYQLPVASNVVLKVYDVLGNEVAELVSSEMPAGLHKIDFNAAQLSSGIYFYTLHAGNFHQTRKMLLIK